MFDHVQIAATDLESAARRFERDYGLKALPGGRHPGRGTANLIIPLGGCYLELIAVVDREEAGRLPASNRVLRALEQGRSFAVWIARADDLDAVRARLLAEGWALPEVSPGARVRPDGTRLEWRMQEVEEGAPLSALPFLIEWRVAAAAYPGAEPVRHRAAVTGVAEVRLSDPEPERSRARLAALLGGGVAAAVEAGPAGVRGLVLETESGPLEIR